MIAYHHSTVNWIKTGIILLYVLLFLFLFFPMTSFPNNTFHFVWGFVGIIGALDFILKIKNDEVRNKFRSLLVGLLIGAFLVSYSWIEFNPSLGEFGVALSPLFMFTDVLTLNKKKIQ